MCFYLVVVVFVSVGIFVWLLVIPRWYIFVSLAVVFWAVRDCRYLSLWLFVTVDMSVWPFVSIDICLFRCS